MLLLRCRGQITFMQSNYFVAQCELRNAPCLDGVGIEILLSELTHGHPICGSWQGPGASCCWRRSEDVNKVVYHVAAKNVKAPQKREPREGLGRGTVYSSVYYVRAV